MNSENCMIKHSKVWLYGIIVIQCIVIVVFACRKSNLYWDEFHTFENAHYFFEQEKWADYLPDFIGYNSWTSVSDAKSIYEMSEREWCVNHSFIGVLTNFFLVEPYQAILNFILGLFAMGEIDFWPPIVFNIIIFILTQIMIYTMTKELCRSDIYALITVGLYGFSAMAVSMAVFVRQYTWSTMLIVFVTMCHYYMWKEEKIYKRIVFEILSFLALYMAFKSTPIVLFYYVPLFLSFSLFLILKRKWSTFFVYSLPAGIGGVVYITLFTDYTYALFHLNEYLVKTQTGQVRALVNWAVEMTPIDFYYRLGNFLYIFWNMLFGHAILMVLWGIMAVVAIAILFQKNGKEGGNEDNRGVAFLVILVLTAVGFGILSCIFYLTEIRYYAMCFPLISVITVCIIGLGAKASCQFNQLFTYITVCLLLFTVGATFWQNKIENVYYEDRQAKVKVESSDLPNVIAEDKFYFVSQNCVYYAKPSSQMYMTKSLKECASDLPQEFLLWTEVENSEDMCKQAIELGYDVTDFSHIYQGYIYQCKK